MALIYILDTDAEIVTFTVIPWEMKESYTLKGNWKVESLIQLKCVGDYSAAGFSCGHTMRNSETCWKMKYKRQVYIEENGVHRIETVLESDYLRGIHVVSYCDNDESITVWTEVLNIGEKTEQLERLSSFSLCGLFGISEEERATDFRLHRLRSRWSAEGLLETRSFLEMQLEPSWQRYRPAVSGGIADREFGHWTKTLKTGEQFISPKAELTSCIGELDDVSNRITSRQKEALHTAPASEHVLSILFKEFCTTWGTPSAERIETLAARLEGKGIAYFVIDAGWYADPEKGGK